MINEFDELFYTGFHFEELDLKFYQNMCEVLPDAVYNSTIMSDIWYDYSAMYCMMSV